MPTSNSHSASVQLGSFTPAGCAAANWLSTPVSINACLVGTATKVSAVLLRLMLLLLQGCVALLHPAGPAEIPQAVGL